MAFAPWETEIKKKTERRKQSTAAAFSKATTTTILHFKGNDLGSHYVKIMEMVK